MRIRKHLFVLAIAVFSLAVSAGCQKPGVEAARQTDLTPKKILSIDDEKFLHAAEKAELRQNSFAQLAQERSKKGKNPGVCNESYRRHECCLDRAERSYKGQKYSRLPKSP